MSSGDKYSSNEMKKILLIGHDGFYNRGCEAIVRGTVEIIKHYIRDSEITLCSYTPNKDAIIARENNIEIDAIIPGARGAKRLSLAWLWQNFDRRILSFNIPLNDYLNLTRYRKHDAVISIGGDNFTDDYRTAHIYFSSMRYAKKAGAKTVIWAASIGPFNDKKAAKKWTKIMNGVDLITVREDLTVKYLESLGVTDNVRRVADPAFLVSCSKPNNLSFEFRKSNLMVGIGMSSLISRYGIKRVYIRAFADFICYLWRSLDAQVVLIPHVTGKSLAVNDIAACNEVQALLPTSCPITILSENYNACEMKYCISQCDFFIGARTHSAIASLSMEIPTITIAYSTKAWGINNQVLSTDEFVIPIAEVSYSRLLRTFNQLQKKKNEIIKRLHNSMPSVRSLAMKGGEYLANILS